MGSNRYKVPRCGGHVDKAATIFYPGITKTSFCSSLFHLQVVGPFSDSGPTKQTPLQCNSIRSISTRLHVRHQSDGPVWQSQFSTASRLKAPLACARLLFNGLTCPFEVFPAKHVELSQSQQNTLLYRRTTEPRQENKRSLYIIPHWTSGFFIQTHDENTPNL